MPEEPVEATAATVADSVATAAENAAQTAGTAIENVAQTVGDAAGTAVDAVAGTVENAVQTVVAVDEPSSCTGPICPYKVLGGIALAVVVVVALVVILRRCRKGRSCGCCGDAPVAKDGKMIEIYVGNISYAMTDDQLRKEFERFGVVKSARVIGHRASGKSKGFGFVEMPHAKEADIAIKNLNNREVMGRKLRVNVSRHPIPKS